MSKSQNRILLVEDQSVMQMLVKSILQDDEHEVICAGDTSAAAQLLQNEHFDLILLDITLPDQDGLEFYAELKTLLSNRGIPVIFLTGKQNLANKVTAFDLGAEDYITKPFEHAELRARVRAKIRKKKTTEKSNEEPLIGPFRFKLATQQVFDINNNIEISLTPREFKLLYFFASHPDAVMDRPRILKEVWSTNTHVTSRTIDTNIYMLRKKLGPLSTHIESISGAGYRFILDTYKKVG